MTSHSRRGTSETSIASVIHDDSASSSRRGSEEDNSRSRGSGALRIFKRKESRYQDTRINCSPDVMPKVSIVVQSDMILLQSYFELQSQFKLNLFTD